MRRLIRSSGQRVFCLLILTTVAGSERFLRVPLNANSVPQRQQRETDQVFPAQRANVPTKGLPIQRPSEPMVTMGNACDAERSSVQCHQAYSLRLACFATWISSGAFRIYQV